MIQLVQIVSGLVGSVAASVGAAVAVMQVRREPDGQEVRASRSSPRSEKAFRRLTRPASMLMVGSILAVVSVLLLFQGLFGGDQPAPAATRLLNRLITRNERNCTPVDPAPGAIAALACDHSKPPIRDVTISLFPNVKALERAQKARIAELGVSQGNCYTQALAWEPSKHGSLICDSGDGRIPASLRWSRSDSRVLVEATAVPGATRWQLYKWWLDDSVGSPANNRLPYPDALESYVLERTGLSVDVCERDSLYRDSLAALSCGATVPDFLFLGYYGDLSTLNNAIDVRPSDGSCVYRQFEPKQSHYSIRGEDVGMRACYHNDSDQTFVVEWINQRSRLYGFASVAQPGSSLPTLFSWWRRHGRFLTD